MTIENKSFIRVDVKALDATEEFPHGSFEAVLSTDDLDRDDEIIDFGAFNPLPEYLPALVDHTAKAECVVGWGVPVYEDGKLYLRGPFDPDEFSQTIRGKLKSGSIRKMSIGFMNAKRVRKDGKTHVTQAEALEGSFVVIPANREATVTTVKAYADVTPPAGSFEEIQESVQKALVLAHEDAYVCLVATFDSKAVYKVLHWPATDKDGTFSTEFTKSVDGVELGEATSVEIQQVISAKDLERWQAKEPAVQAEAKAFFAKDAEVDENQVTLDDLLIEAELLETELGLDEMETDNGIEDQVGDDEFADIDADIAAFNAENVQATSGTA